MAITTAIMFGVSAVAQGVGAITEAGAQREQAKYQEHQFNTNAKMAENQAADEIRRGELEANQQGQKGKALQGTQRAAYAAQGVDVNTGAAADTQAETAALAAIDMEQIKENAWRAAWGYKVEAANSRGKGRMTRVAGENSANNTLLTGGLKALGSLTQGAYTLKGAIGGTPAAEAPKYKASDEWGVRGPGSR